MYGVCLRKGLESLFWLLAYLRPDMEARDMLTGSPSLGLNIRTTISAYSIWAKYSAVTI